MAGATGVTFLDVVSGKLKQMIAVATGGGTGPAANRVLATDSGGKLDVSFLPTGVGPEILSVPVATGVTLTTGDFVHITTNTGTQAQAVKATASSASGTAKPAVGFVLADFTQGSMASIYTLSQTNNVLSGLVPGMDYFLSATIPGGITQTVPTVSRDMVQYIGRAATDKIIVFSNVITIELA